MSVTYALAVVLPLLYFINERNFDESVFLHILAYPALTVIGVATLRIRENRSWQIFSSLLYAVLIYVAWMLLHQNASSEAREWTFYIAGALVGFVAAMRLAVAILGRRLFQFLVFSAFVLGVVMLIGEASR